MRRRRPIYVLFLIITLLFAQAAYASDNESPTYQSVKDSIVQKAAFAVQQYGAASIQYALIDNGNITVSGNAGEESLTQNTMYGTGSLSKMFLSTCIMQLVDQGKIVLDQPVITYLPEFKMTDERCKEITVRMLLNHSSGLYGSTFNNAFLFNDTDSYAHDHLLEKLATQRLKADPGEFSVYCNDGFALLELVLEKVTGEDFTEYLHKNLLDPLELKSTKTPKDSFDRNQLAKTYQTGTSQELPVDSVNIIGTGGIYSTAEDVCRFSQIFTGDEQGVLSQKSIEAMQNKEYKRGIWPEESDNIIGYGLGWDSVDSFPFNNYKIAALVKGGDTQIYHSSLVVLPEYHIAAAVLSSGGSSTIDQLLSTDMLLNTLYEKGIIKQINPPKSFGKTVPAKIPENLKQFAGTYGNTMQSMKIDFDQDSTLTITSLISDQIPVEKFTYTNDQTFISADGKTKMSFVKEKNGETYLWTRNYTDLPPLGQIAISEYTVQKFEPNEITEEVASAWNNRSGKFYYLLNEKYSSQMYLGALGAAQIKLNDKLPWYLAGSKIADKDTAINVVKIPVLSGRDTTDYKFYTKDGIEYLETAGSIFKSGDSVPNIFGGESSICTIQPDGYARWFMVGETEAGRTMTVEIPDHASFSVYDSKGACIFSSYVSGKNTVTLPQGGSIVFAGDAGKVFDISLK